ncbi:MAG: PfkB family carbohydrate kinase [Pseudomonadota bacterium]
MRESSRPLVFGEALVDAFADGVVPGGAPFNVACHLAALGRAPRLVTRLGRDPAGDALRAAAARFGLSLDEAQADAETARVLVHERPEGHAFEIPDAQAFDRIDAADAVAVAQRAGPGAWLYFGTLALRAGPSRQALAAIRTTLPHRAYVDLNWREAGPAPSVILDLLRDVHVLKLSDEELGRLLGWLDLAGPAGMPAPGDRDGGIAALCQRTGARTLLVTHGGEGAVAWDAGGHCVARALAPPLARIVDTVGAGDAFSGMMLAGLVQGEAAGTVLDRAVAFASASCGWRGALPADPAVYARWRTPPDHADIEGATP